MASRVVGIGQAGIDHLAVVDRYPEADANVELAGLSIQGGGTMATALATLANFDAKVAFVGKLSDDDFGRFIVRGLEQLGIETSAMVIDPGKISPYRFVIVERETHRRTVLRTDGSVAPLSMDEIDLPGCLEGADLLLLDGYQVEVQIKAAEEAKRRGIRVVLDAGRISEGMGELVPLTDVLIASERYASDVAPRGEIEDSVLELGRMVQTVVVTMGEEGSIGLEGDKLVRQPPLAIQVVDTTGAGDVFLGGYCHGLLQGWPLERCIQVASAAAGLSCCELGGRAGLPSLDAVMQKI